MSALFLIYINIATCQSPTSSLTYTICTIIEKSSLLQIILHILNENFDRHRQVYVSPSMGWGSDILYSCPRFAPIRSVSP